MLFDEAHEQRVDPSPAVAGDEDLPAVAVEDRERARTLEMQDLRGACEGDVRDDAPADRLVDKITAVGCRPRLVVELDQIQLVGDTHQPLE